MAEITSVAEAPASLWPPDSEVTGQRGTALELAGVEKRLVVTRELERVSGFVGMEGNLRFVAAGTVPGNEPGNRHSP
jgi:hypothetical protein